MTRPHDDHTGTPDADLAVQAPSHYKELVADIEQGAGHPQPDVVATITMDSVDADGEVVLPQGGDFGRFVRNPVVMLCHSHGKPGEYYPLPIARSLWIKARGNRVLSGFRFARSTEMGREVHGLFKEDILRTVSIGFLSIEASPPTREELAQRPDWRGAKLIHRRWLLLEYSVVPIPANPDAIGRYVGKGGRIPAYLSIPSSFQLGSQPAMSGHAKVIRHEHGQYVLYTRDGSKVISRHATKEGAQRQEAAIEAAQRQGKGLDDHVKIHPKMGGGCGMVRSIHGDDAIDTPHVFDDHTEGARPAGLVELHDEAHKGLGLHKAFPLKGLAGFDDPAPFGEDAEEGADGDEVRASKGVGSGPEAGMGDGDGAGADPEATRRRAEMVKGLLDRHKSILHSGKAGHLHAHVAKGHAHYVYHDDDLQPEKGYHQPEQIRAILGTGPHIKEVHVKRVAPDAADGFERLHPPPAGFVPAADTTKAALAESSGVTGGYAVPIGHQAAKDPAHPDHDDLLPSTEADHDYQPKPGHFVKWAAHHGMHHGAGRVVSVHKGGRVPDVDNEAHASDADPHARIELHRHKGGGVYESTKRHVGVQVKHLRRMAMLAGIAGDPGSDGSGPAQKGVESARASKGVIPFEPTPVVAAPFDHEAAVGRLRKWASHDGSGRPDAINWLKYAKGFAWHDPALPDDFGSYQHPHHDIQEGRLVAVKAGVQAQLATLDSDHHAVIIPTADIPGVRAHLQQHLNEGTDGKGLDAPVREPSAVPKFRTAAQVEASLVRRFADQETRSRPGHVDAEADRVLERILGAV